MNNLTNQGELLVLDWLNGVGNPYRPRTPLLIALYLTLPDPETGLGGVEVTGGGYRRMPCTMSPAANGSAQNASDVNFPTATSTWGTIVGGGIWDNEQLYLLWTGAFTTPRLVSTGEDFYIPSSSISLALN